MKRKALVGSLLSITAAASLIVSSTYALFTSEAKTDISITSGTVKVSATVENLKLYSRDILQSDNFENGGTVSFDEQEKLLKIDRITPMDKVEFDIRVRNESNVKIKSRTIVKTTENDGLFRGLEVEIDNEKMVSGYSKITKWSEFEETENDGSKLIHISIELPEEAGEEYMNKSCGLSVTLEAVQGNALTVDLEENQHGLCTTSDLTQLVDEINQGNGQQNVVLMDDVVLPEEGIDTIGNIDNFFTGDFDGNNHTISNVSSNLFGYVEGATIENLTLETNSESDFGSNGILGEYIRHQENYTEPTVISNVTVSGEAHNARSAFFLDAASSYHPQDENGVSIMKEPELIFNDCVNNVNLDNDKDNRAAGFISTPRGISIEMNRCVNNGDFNLVTTKESHVGGIIGYVMRDTFTQYYADYTVRLNNCVNNGNFYSKSTTDGDGRVNAGGIVSTAHQGYVEINGCINNGDITGDSAAGKNQACVGGIVSRANSNSIKITNSTNTGNIKAIGSVGASNAYAGGIIGFVDSKAGASTYELLNVASLGKVSAETVTGTANYGLLIGRYTEKFLYNGDAKKLIIENASVAKEFYDQISMSDTDTYYIVGNLNNNHSFYADLTLGISK